MEPVEEAGLEERLKSALWLSIGKIVDEETMKLGVNATPQFIGALTEMVWSQIGTWMGVFWVLLGVSAVCKHREGIDAALNHTAETVGQDLESFAKHAGRSTINVSDVMLLARRNEGLESILRAFVEQQHEEES